MHSDTFKEALAAHDSAGPFVLPRTTGQQAVLFLQMLYAACGCSAWVDARSFAKVQQLAIVCHALACPKLLDVLDKALVKLAGNSITIGNALEAYMHAQLYELPSFQQKIAQMLIYLLPKLDLTTSGLQDGAGCHLLAALKEAQRIQADKAQILFRIYTWQHTPQPIDALAEEAHALHLN